MTNDLTITIATIDNEARILDTDLAEALGYERPRVIRDLIKRYDAALTALGPLCRTVRQTGGRPAEEFYLNKAQAVFITTQSGTTRAVEITVKVAQKFDAYERGVIQPQLPNFANPAEAARAWAVA
jgi:hypothetical protein